MRFQMDELSKSVSSRKLWTRWRPTTSSSF